MILLRSDQTTRHAHWPLWNRVVCSRPAALPDSCKTTFDSRYHQLPKAVQRHGILKKYCIYKPARADIAPPIPGRDVCSSTWPICAVTHGRESEKEDFDIPFPVFLFIIFRVLRCAACHARRDRSVYLCCSPSYTMGWQPSCTPAVCSLSRGSSVRARERLF
jgi:hypothetical protein